jgi:hypothetical protein
MRNLLEQSESNDSLAAVFTKASDTPAPPVSPANPARSSLAPGVYPICGLAPAANGEAATAPSYVYSFDRHALIKAIPRPEQISAKAFVPAAEELFDRIMQMTDNAGATDEHRALNYLVMRHPGIYAKAAEEFARDFSLSGVEVHPSPLSGIRNIVDVIFAYTNRNTDFSEKFCVRVDVTEEFPFLVTKLSPYYDR